ncbi:hypothetical protein KAR28_01760 [Candidatus Parcubacteria bacterium]|nr:hypothetical protein [Candidatus Parcubacteria bacterium]
MNLDSKKQFEKLDPHFVGKSIEYLPDQMRQVLKDSRLIKIPREYSQTSHIVVNGMGGSNIGSRIIKEAFHDQITKPLMIEPGYRVPAYVGKNTLYIISSYSGTTEEPLSTYRTAKKQGAKIMAITENSPKSKLLKLMLKENIPGVIFKPEYNPSNQPRMGLGYSIFGQLILIAKSGALTLKIKEMEEIISRLELWTRKLRVESFTKQNPAKKIALQLANKRPTIVAAEFLKGNIKALRNQMSESSKHLPNFLEIPELNHYAMEGLAYPVSRKKDSIFLFFDSGLYHPRIILRTAMTKQVIKKNKIAIISHGLKGKNKHLQSFELLQLGTWISYYLGIINQVDPIKIPYVDWFKEQLAKK